VTGAIDDAQKNLGLDGAKGGGGRRFGHGLFALR
jgi:hypothetical protein